MQIAATHGQRFSTFLLEMALDEARMRKHFAARLLEERVKRGHGDARKFPQPRMADLLKVSLRAYQGWEGEERLPGWRNLQEIADEFGTSVEDLLGGRVTEADLVSVPEPESPPADRLDAILDRLESISAAVEKLSTKEDLQRGLDVLREAIAARASQDIQQEEGSL